MSIHRYFLAAVVTLSVLVPQVARAQTGVPGTTAGPTASNVPIIMSGQLPSAAPTDEAPLKNVFTGSITTGSFFDDNAQLGLPQRQWDLGYTIFPRLAFTETLPRFEWSLSYAPGFEVSQNLFFRSIFTQNFGGQFNWLMTRHSTLSVQQDYVRGVNPFQHLQTNPGPTVGPNTTIFLPSLRETSILTHLLYSYQFSPHSSLGLGGTFDRRDVDSIPHTGPTTQLITSQVVSGEAYFSHDFSPSNQFGAQYGIQVMKFPGQDARTTTHTFVFFDQMSLGRNATLSIYGGPEYSQTFNQVQLNYFFFIITIPIRADEWDYSTGALYTWTGHRVGVQLNYSRRISDGGGLVGAVKLNAGTATLNFHLSPSWSLSSILSAADDQLLSVNNGSQNDLISYSAGASLNRRLTKDVYLEFSYRRANQTGGISGFPIGNHDLAGMSLRYQFMKPLGR